jgi:hypothetical protein
MYKLLRPYCSVASLVYSKGHQTVLPTLSTIIRLFSSVDFLVYNKGISIFKGFHTFFTLIRCFFSVDLQVIINTMSNFMVLSSMRSHKNLPKSPQNPIQ